MDYEKKYNEALEKARMYRDNAKAVEEYAAVARYENIFPELRESEDEKIRTLLVALVQWAKNFKQSGLDSNTANKMLLYLEKQKEPILTSIWKDTKDEIAPAKRDILGWYRKADGKLEGRPYIVWFCSEDESSKEATPSVNGTSLAYWAELPNEDFKKTFWYDEQKEQKPALTPERIHPKFAVGDKVCRPMWSDHTIREIYVRCNDPVYVCVNEEGTESHIPFSEQDEWERKEQKPAEKQDYSGLNELERAILRGFLCAGVENVPVGIIKDTAAECMGYLALIEPVPAEWSKEDERSHKDLIHYFERLSGCLATEVRHAEIRRWLSFLKSLHPQSKQEWSEEDEEMWMDIKCNLIHGSFLPFDKIEWLETRLKSLRPQPHWKPSDEQLRPLEYAIDYFKKKRNDTTYLESLYNDLKKLM